MSSIIKLQEEKSEIRSSSTSSDYSSTFVGAYYIFSSLSDFYTSTEDVYIAFHSDTTDAQEIIEKKKSAEEILEDIFTKIGRKPKLLRDPSEIFKEEYDKEKN